MNDKDDGPVCENTGNPVDSSDGEDLTDRLKESERENEPETNESDSELRDWQTEDYKPIHERISEGESTEEVLASLGRDSDESNDPSIDWKGDESFHERTMRELEEKGPAQLSREMGIPHSENRQQGPQEPQGPQGPSGPTGESEGSDAILEIEPLVHALLSGEIDKEEFDRRVEEGDTMDDKDNIIMGGGDE